MLLNPVAQIAALTDWQAMTDPRAAPDLTSFLCGVCSAFPWPTMLQRAPITVRRAARGLACGTVSWVLPALLPDWLSQTHTQDVCC